MKQTNTDNYLMIFKEEIRNVWNNADKAVNFDNIQAEIRDNDDGAIMSVRVGFGNHTTKAIGLSLQVRVGDKIPVILYISPRAFDMSEEDFRALLRHEALHFGYPRHDANFKYYVKKIKAPLTEYEITESDTKEEYVVKYQPKKGARFVKLKSFDDKDEAIAYQHEYMIKHQVRTRTTWKV